MTEPAIEKRRENARRSVTRDNAFPIDRGGGYFQILVPSVQPQAGLLPPFLPIDYRMRDIVLDSTVRADAMWSAAIGIAITKAAALAWEAKSDGETRSKRAQELLLGADSTSISGIGGWVSYMGKQVRNFTCTNAGCFTEIIRATGAYGSRIVGLGHLSALRMRRTGDPEYPFIYIDRWGRQHVMRWWQVFNLVDMPDPDEAALGAGLCAAERAYQQIRKLAALEQYLYEKISGSRPLALHIVNGLTKDQLTDMIASASENQASKGLGLYMGAIVATTLKPDAPPALVTIPLAELPDGFEATSERDRADLIYANALGLDPQDLKPMSNQQMGAGAQSEVLNQKAEGRGQAAYRQQLTHMLNQLVFDNKTQFLFTEHDYRDQQAAVNVSAARGTFVTGLVAGGVISGPQAQQILVEQGELPKAFIEQAAQPGSDLSDTDKPDVNDPLNDASGPPQPQNQPVMQTQAPTPSAAPTAPTGPQGTTPPPLVPKTTSTTAQPAAVLRQKAAPGRSVHHRSVQAGARRVLRQLNSKGAISTKAAASGGVWRTIHGHPVLVGGGSSSGGGGSGGSAAGSSTKKPTKTYVPKPAAGGSSIYPTLDAYKKGTLSHADTLVALKDDIKAAKLAGNTKAVNSLTSHYYAIKNGPHAGAPATASTNLGGLGKPSILGHPANPTMSQHEAKLAAHKITEDFINDKIQTTSEMNTKLSAIGAQSGHTVDQLKALAKAHDEELKAAGTKATSTNANIYAAEAHHIMMEHVAGKTTADEMGAKLADLSDVTGVPKNDLIEAAKAHNQQLKGPGAPPPAGLATSSKFAAIEGSAIHGMGQQVDDHIKKGIATQADVDYFHENVKSQIAQEQSKVQAAEAATKSALAAGLTPLPSIVKMNNDALDKIDALQALDKHVTASEGLYGVGSAVSKSAKQAGVTEQQFQTALNITNLYSAGTIPLSTYQTNISKIAAGAGVSQGKIEKVIEQHQTAHGTGGAATPAKSSTLPSPPPSAFIEHNGQQYHSISSQTAAHEWGEQQQWPKPLTTAEKKAIYDYSYQGDEAINTKLRFGKDLDYPTLKGPQEPARRDRNIEHLDAVMARSSVPTNVQVNRGFSNPELLRRMNQGLPLEGAVFRDNGFVSTAVASTGAFNNEIKAKIRVPKGSQGAYIAPHVKSSYYGETELLLPRGSNFKITGYRKVTTDFSSYYELEMDYLGPQEIPGAFKARW